MYRISFTNQAKKDLIEIKEYISTELQNPLAAQNTVTQIVQSVMRLKQFPQNGSSLHSPSGNKTHYRFIVVKNYMAFYKIGAEEVLIVRVMYGKRDYLKILFDDFLEE